MFVCIIAQVFDAVRMLCLTQLREEIGKLDIDQAFSSREHLGRTLLSDLNEVTRRWGVEITRVELQELQPSETIAAGTRACSVYAGARSHMRADVPNEMRRNSSNLSAPWPGTHVHRTRAELRASKTRNCVVREHVLSKCATRQRPQVWCTCSLNSELRNK